jgi:AcrR family transcriptional regulator
MQRVANRKIQILSVAGRLFSASGYDAVTVKQIADECNVTEPAIYRHFPSKEAIFGAVLESLGARIDTAELFKRLEREDDIETILRGLADHIIAFYTTNPDLHRLLLYSVLCGHERARQVFGTLRGTYVKFLQQQLVRLHRQGAIIKKNNEITARCFIGSLFDCALSMTLWKGFQGKCYTPRDVADNNVPIFARGLRSV